jgi:CPA2 family monovalent cation:H+ antiporter-2
MQSDANFLSDFAMVTGVAALTSMIARALGQPTILGYLVAGLIVGPSIPFPLFADLHRIEALAEFGVVLVMFSVGLEFRVARLLRVLPLSGFTALVQVAALGWAGFTLGVLLGWDTVGAAFLGSALAISSTMVVTSLFGQQQVDEDVREHVLGVLVVQDLVAIVLIAMMTAVGAGQELAAGELVQLLARLFGVLAAMLVLGMLVVPRLVQHVVRQRRVEGIAVLAVGVAFTFALLAEAAGYSVALGAFVAGIAVAESGLGTEVEHAIEPLRAVFAAIFFVSIGMSVDPLVALDNLHIALLISLVVILAQLGSVTVASVLSGSPLRRAVLSGLALGQIGELSFILAGIGAASGAVPDSLLPTLVTAAALTTFTTPLLLKRGYRLVRELDRRLPASVQHLIAVHQGFVTELREEEGTDEPLRQAVRALVIDWLALVGLAMTGLAVQRLAEDLLRQLFGLSDMFAAMLVDVGVVAVCVPVLVALFFNARGVARLAARRVRPDVEDSRSAQVVGLLQALASLVLMIGVGIPALAVLRPLVRGPWAEPVILMGLLGAAILVLRNLSQLEGAFASGAVELAQQLSRHAAGQEHHFDNELLIPGLDHVFALPILAEANSAGKTLAQLNLRARTGATVVAIRRADRQVVLPEGSARVEAGDVLALAGPPEAVAKAREVLTDQTVG